MAMNNQIPDPSSGENFMQPMESPAEAPIGDPSMLGGSEAGLTGGARGANGMTEEEMRFDIERMFKKIDDKDSAFSESRGVEDDRAEQMKASIVKEIFSYMSELGVDLSDLNSINKFMQKLETDNPDIFKMFEIAMDSLSPEVPDNQLTLERPNSGTPTQEVQNNIEEPNLMNNKTENLQNNTLMS